jgi:hypothetical protein
MAIVAKSGTPSITTLTPCPAHHLPLIAGEAIAAGDACYIKASDGKAYRCDGTTLNAAAAKCDGFAAMAAAINKPVTLYRDVVFAYGASLVPGAKYYVAASPNQGQLDTSPTTGGTAHVATAVNDKEILVTASTY